MSGRRIAPRPAPQSEGTATFSVAGSNTPVVDASIESQPTWSQTQDTAAVSSIRKKVTSACQGCQKRRVKCDGHHPCGTCLRSKHECSYLPELDGRSIKRKFHQVQQDQDLLHDLLDTLRNTTDENVSQIVSLIRSDASLDDIKACVTQQLVEARIEGRERSPEFRQLQKSLNSLDRDNSSRVGPPHRCGALEIQRLADSPLYKFSASPWTTVTNDDDLISNLISVWLTWDKGWYDWIDEDLFVRDMQAGRLDCMFCSPFLVNCILAWCCPYSDFKEARTVNGDTSPLMMAFIEEARRLVEEPSNTVVSLTTIQGLLVLHGALAVSGLDSIGYRYLLQGIGMMADLANSPVAARSHQDPQIIKEISQATDRTSWGVYMISTQTLTALLKPQTMKIPHRPRPEKSMLCSAQRMWAPYSVGGVPIFSYRDELFGLACDNAITEAELSRTLFDQSEQRTRLDLETRIIKLHGDLHERSSRLPSELRSRRGSCPSCITHEVRVQGLVLRMFMTLREPTEGASQIVVQLAKTRCVEAAGEMARLCKIYLESWGATRFSVMMCHPCLIGLSVLLEEKNTSRYGNEITDLCIALRGMSRRWPLCMAMLRMVQMEARQKDWTLPAETDKLFEEFEDSAWKQRSLKRYVTLYPISTTSKTINLTGNEIDMGSFLAAMEQLEVADSDAEQD